MVAHWHAYKEQQIFITLCVSLSGTYKVAQPYRNKASAKALHILSGTQMTLTTFTLERKETVVLSPTVGCTIHLTSKPNFEKTEISCRGP